jgi:hypothetical protein
MPQPLYLRERALVYIGEWMGLRDGLDFLEKTNTYMKKTAKQYCTYTTNRMHVQNPQICKNLLI